MRTIIKSITFIALVCVTIFGAYVLYQNGDLTRFFPDNTAGKDTVAQSTKNHDNNPSKNTKKKKDPKAFVAPTVGNPSEVFVHENGFEHGKENFKKQGVHETVDMDKGRVSQVSFRLAQDSVLLYSVGPEDTKAFTEHQLTENGATYCFAGTAWQQNMHPYLSSIAQWMKDNKTNVIVVVTFEYSDDKDTAAEYVTLRAFSLEDLGKTLSVNTTFHQYTKDKALDYKTKNYATAETKAGN